MIRQPPLRPSDSLEAIESELLLEAIYRHYGFDFRGYAQGSLRRRLWRRADAEGVDSLSGLQERVLHDPEVLQRLLVDLSINVTAMFRDPSFYVSFRTRVVPLLRTYPFVRLWNAGCSTGEETLSLAILLREEGIADKVRMYATDINESVVERARAGVFPLEKMREYTRNYLAAGGTEEFSTYYVADGDTARFDPSLTEHVVFAQHNLASDSSFNQFNAIVCRNVMIYFGKTLQDQVHNLFYESLEMFGLLGLGRSESIGFTLHEHCYQPLVDEDKLYRKAC